jgi:hypothetical protein
MYFQIGPGFPSLSVSGNRYLSRLDQPMNEMDLQIPL